MTDVTIVQHGEKEARPGDPRLTDRGREQAASVAELLASEDVAAVYSSPLRRALETAAVIANRLGRELVLDERLQERMNWEGHELDTLEDFLAEWRRATDDRDYVPVVGDSSRSAAARFRRFLDDVAIRHPGELVVAVSHGGVTIDCLRDLLGDHALERESPGLFQEGVLNGALTRLRRQSDGWEVLTIADTSHLGR